MDHEAYVMTVREQSERFLEALADAPSTTPVPTCPGWTAADLLHHLTEVQHTWSRVVAEGLEGPDVPEPVADEPITGAARAGTALLAALEAHRPEQPCWSWHEAGGTVGWVARRQAHEALVHRVDAELTAGLAVRPPPVDLAADGVDEVLTVMLDGVPAWGTFTPDGTTVVLRCSNHPDRWTVRLGRFAGTSPTTGTTHDLDAAAVDRGEPADGASDLTVTGAAWDLDRWLWGRGDAQRLEVAGPTELLDRLRALLAETTG
ncbi:maleylpyruvate isomerase family mycothiol-dependent enzyme [Actinotalea sp. K2]|uniref:maleylpyruvate isomerase family mycothiol-dependent enzyme n=1 Tax=Actinotalea sp. K2 TaxID=2939438 RepID=UPI002016E6E1|nr:maleylpyruvate isomerase family mycothiol-dependent enzyme [Actinotalea sp. K2]MCL3859872.1 maleylpyruvate isomerase family mycothiol-dependent enzyme [Actinotalea sp. K2]